MNRGSRRDQQRRPSPTRCPSAGRFNGGGRGWLPHCPSTTQAPADGTSQITLTFDASTISNATVLSITLTGATFVGGSGTFAPSGGSLTYPANSVLLTGSPVTVTAGSTLSLASATAGVATVTVVYSNTSGTSIYDSVESLAFTALPTSKADCQHGGWANFTDSQGTTFTNQSACMKWLKANT